jgi:hypothetical protein
MGEEFLSCGFVGFPGTPGTGVVYLRDRHAGGCGFLECFEPWDIDRKEPISLPDASGDAYTVEDERTPDASCLEPVRSTYLLGLRCP